MKKFFTALLFISLVLALVASPVIADNVIKVERKNAPSFLGYAPDRLVVVLKPEAGVIKPKLSPQAVAVIGNADFDKISTKFAVSGIKKQFATAKTGTLSRYYKVKLEAGTLDEAYEAYSKNPLVERVEKVGMHAMYATPNDTYYDPYQWYHNATGDHDIDSPEAWDIQTGADATIVALLDSGTRYYHPDLGGANASVSNPGNSRGNMWINTAELNGSSGVDDDGNGYVDDWIGYDFIDGVSNCWTGEDCNTKDNDPRDFNGHGTHTAGIIGMMTNDGYGMAGVAGGWGSGSQTEYGNGVKVMPLRMGYSYNYLGQEYGVVMMDAAAEAFYYAADNGAKIASCSWGSSNSGGIGAAVDYFIAHGGIVCVAAGNDGAETSADYLNGRGDCISVSATDENDNGASFTTYGTWVDICAPGNNIYSTYHDHTDPNTIYWASMGGTSMATPMVAGVVGLIWSQNPSWTVAQVKTQLYSSVDNIDAYLSSKYIGKMGAGRINAYNAVNTGPPPAPVANFSGSPTSGTVPLTVIFTDLSTGSITSWSWNFGDGGGSTSQNPSHQYTSAGTYSVSLTVTGPGGSDTETKTNYITVNPCVAPTAGFVGSPTSGDYPLLVSFTDQSSGATSYSWNFGDGGSSTVANPSHTYTAAGTFTVTQTVTNSCGSDQMVRTNYITVTTPPCDPPVADFIGSPTSGDFNLTVYFTDLSTNSPTSWSWTFGDGGTSTSQNPSHTYTAAGTYDVTLTATNSCGSDGETKVGYMTVTEPSTDYASLPYSTGFETGSFDSYWFTQSSNSNGRIQITSANTPRGAYHMTMDVATNGTYAQNEAWLRLNLAGKTNVDLTFYWKEFSDETQTQDGVFFSDNGGSSFTKVYSLANGTSTYQQIALDVDALASSYGLSLTGTFVVKFQQYDNYSITTDGMAFDDISVISNDVPPTANFSATPTSGEFPLAVQFTDASSNATSWSWNFGDGGTSTAQNPSHTYMAAGTFTVSLTATNAYGSDQEVKTNYITVTSPPPPTAEFSGTPTSGYYPLAVVFTDESTDDPTGWSWSFGDGGTSTAQNPSHTYTAAGTFTVSLTATNAYGSDTETKVDYIVVSEPGTGGWVTITYDDFESGWGSYTDGGGDCALYVGGTYAHQGSNAADIQDNSGVASSFYHTVGYNVSGYTELEVEFWYYAVSMDNSSEDFWLQYYDGSSWLTVDTWARSIDFNNNTFYNVVVSIPSSTYNYPTNARLRFVCDASGNQDDVYIDEIEFRGFSSTAAVKTIALLPNEFSLSQNYPNPFNPATTFEFSLPIATHVTMEIYNLLGQKVATPIDAFYEAGVHTLTWNADGKASGVYFYRINAGEFTAQKKMLLLK